MIVISLLLSVTYYTDRNMYVGAHAHAHTNTHAQDITYSAVHETFRAFPFV